MISVTQFPTRTATPGGGPAAGVVLTRLPMYRRTRAAFRAGAAAHPGIAVFVAALHSAVPPELGGGGLNR